MKPSIYAEMCKPSPLSKPPKPEVKMLTTEEFETERKRLVRCAYEHVKVRHYEVWRMLGQREQKGAL